MSEIVPMPYPICLLKTYFEYILISFWASWSMCLVCLNINWCYGWSRIFWSYINPNPLLICSEREAKLKVRGRSQTTFTRFDFLWLPPSVYIFYGIKVYKKSIFLTTYPPPLVNVVCEKDSFTILSILGGLRWIK